MAAEDVTEDLAELEILDFQEEGTKLSIGSHHFVCYNFVIIDSTNLEGIDEDVHRGIRDDQEVAQEGEHL